MYKITKGADRSKGIKTVIYGQEGVGKTTLASKFPDPVFIDTEGSTSQYEDISRMPAPKNWRDLNQMIEWLAKEKPCKTVVIDTVDWAEAKEVEDLLATSNKESIADFGYGEGYIRSAERIQKFMDELETKLINQGINVVLVCHSQIRKVELPDERGAFDKYELKLGKKTASQTSPIIKEWADLILFCKFEMMLEKTDDPNGKKKARGGQKRIMCTTHSATWDAKNRYGLPDVLPMDFKEIAHIFRKPEVEPKQSEVTPAKSETEVKISDKAIDVMLNSALPDSMPGEFLDFAKEHDITLDVLRIALKMAKHTDKLDFDVTTIPPDFWKKKIMAEWETKYKKIFDRAARDVLPF